jgi:hypothetical protein
MTDPPRNDDPAVDEQPEALVSPADIGSASRSCLAIIVVLAAIVLLLCVFVAVQTFR